MVFSNHLNQTFVQNEISCVLSSYSVVANYFAGVEIHEVFIEYCKIFNIPYFDEIDAELSSSNHLNRICPKILKWRGSQMIHYLHSKSDNPYFLKNRKHFSSSIFTLEPIAQDKFSTLVSHLFDVDSLANFVTAPHSRTLGWDLDKGLFIHDTQAEENLKITFIGMHMPLNFSECILFTSL
jgi:hypothetical protein